jgi:23S rRNA pseudouridine2604 synthase
MEKKIIWCALATGVNSQCGAFSGRPVALLCHGLSLDGQALRPAGQLAEPEQQLRFVLKENLKA